VLLSDSSASAQLSTTRHVARPPNQPSDERLGSDISVTVNAPSSTKRAHQRSSRQRTATLDGDVVSNAGSATVTVALADRQRVVVRLGAFA
jgi:hypothetical protein